MEISSKDVSHIKDRMHTAYQRVTTLGAGHSVSTQVLVDAMAEEAAAYLRLPEVQPAEEPEFGYHPGAVFETLWGAYVVSIEKNESGRVMVKRMADGVGEYFDAIRGARESNAVAGTREVDVVGSMVDRLERIADAAVDQTSLRDASPQWAQVALSATELSAKLRGCL